MSSDVRLTESVTTILPLVEGMRGELERRVGWRDVEISAWLHRGYSRYGTIEHAHGNHVIIIDTFIKAAAATLAEGHDDDAHR